MASLRKLRQIWLLSMRKTTAIVLQWKILGIVPFASFHFGWCVHGPQQAASLYCAHLQSKEALSLCLHCLELLVVGQLKDLLSHHVMLAPYSSAASFHTNRCTS